jgi:polysaccharide biosynthesis transport protein
MNDNTPALGRDPDHRRLPVAVTQRDRALARPAGTALSLEFGGQEPPAGGDDEINLLDYWRIILKRRWSILSVLLAVVTAVVAITLMSTPIYRATATAQIERAAMKVVDVEGLTPAESPGDRDFYQTQYELLRSRALAQRVISQHNLGSNPVFIAQGEPSPLGRLLGLLGSGDNGAPVGAESMQTAYINRLLDNLSIEPVRNSRLVRVHYDSPDPRFSAVVANALVEAFIATNLERRFDASSYAKTFLEDRLEQLKVRLEDSERQLVAFAQEEGIINVDDRQSLVSRTLGEVSTSLSQAEQDRIRAESRHGSAAMGNGEGIPEVLESPIIQTLKGTKAKLDAEYQEKLMVFQPGYPAMQRLRGQIDEVQRQIDREVANIRAAIASEYQSALRREEALRNRLDEMKTESLNLQGRSIQYNILKREVDTNRELYEGLLQRYKEIGVAGGVGTNNVTIVDRAEVPRSRFKPSLTLNLAVGLMLGLMLGVLLAFLLEHMDDTIKNPEDLERVLRLPVLGVIPKVKAAQARSELKDPRSAFAEAYRSVRTALQFASDHGVPRTLFVTSSVAGEGKSTTALTLAENFAQLGKRTLIIDADLRNPSLHKSLKMKNVMGLTNYLVGEAKPPQVLRQAGNDKLFCITSGPLPPNPAELLASPRMASILALAAEKFDQVIIDGPPVLGLADAPILANVADGTLLVVEAGSTRQGYAKGAVKRLHAARAALVGAMLSKFNSRQAGYYYGGYGDYYYYGSGNKAGLLTKA